MSKFLLASPTVFDVRYTINPWMYGNIGRVNNTKACKQWDMLVEALAGSCYILNTQENCPDIVFTANAGFVQDDTFILSNFANPERKAEEPIFEKWFSDRGYDIHKLSYKYEGEGDHLVDASGRHWLGTGFRTQYEASYELSGILNKEILVLDLISPKFYHLDTCFCPLPNGELLWYPQAFSENSRKLICECFHTRVEVDMIDAMMFSCNAIALEDTIILPRNNYCSMNLQDIGYRVTELDLSEFLKAGGAAKCLVLKLGFN